MSQFLPPYLLALFAPRDPVPYLPPVDKLTHEKKRQPYSGLAEYLDQFEEPEETPPPTKVETKLEKIERKVNTIFANSQLLSIKSNLGFK